MHVRMLPPDFGILGSQARCQTLVLNCDSATIGQDSNIGTKCNSLIQQFIGISTTIDTWAACFDSY